MISSRVMVHSHFHLLECSCKDLSRASQSYTTSIQCNTFDDAIGQCCLGVWTLLDLSAFFVLPADNAEFPFSCLPATLLSQNIAVLRIRFLHIPVERAAA